MHLLVLLVAALSHVPTTPASLAAFRETHAEEIRMLQTAWAEAAEAQSPAASPAASPALADPQGE